MKAKLEHVKFSSPDGLELEGVIHYFTDDGSRPAAVVCHPHPLYGGSMHNPLIVEITRALASQGFVVLRFNFRGVGESEGTHDGGYGEQQDVAGAVETLLSRDDVDPERVYLAGWSFGAGVGLTYGAGDERLAGFAVVGLPTDALDDGFLQDDLRPKLFLAGENDQISKAGRLKRWTESMLGPARVVVLSDTDHYLAGREEDGAALIANFLDGLASNAITA